LSCDVETLKGICTALGPQDEDTGHVSVTIALKGLIISFYCDQFTGNNHHTFHPVSALSRCRRGTCKTDERIP
jgi:hypothetical protein